MGGDVGWSRVEPKPASSVGHTGGASGSFTIEIPLEVATSQNGDAERLSLEISPDELTEAEMADVEESLREIGENRAREFKSVGEALKWLKEE